MKNMPLHVIVLAAGEGKRMKSKKAKVLMPLAGRPLLAHVLAAARALSAQQIHVVYGHGGDQVLAAFDGQPDLRWVLQAERLGTGHMARRGGWREDWPSLFNVNGCVTSVAVNSVFSGTSVPRSLKLKSERRSSWPFSLAIV